MTSLFTPFLALPTIAPYLLPALTLAGVLAMYASLKREVAEHTKRNRRIEAMLLRLKEAGPAAGHGAQAPHPAPPADGREAADTAVFVHITPRPGMNLNRRVQALRLLRRGEDLGHIASALGVSRCEIELLVRVHQLTMASLAPSEKPVPAPVRPQSAMPSAP